jgi:hypothetical protein
MILDDVRDTEQELDRGVAAVDREDRARLRGRHAADERRAVGITGLQPRRREPPGVERRDVAAGQTQRLRGHGRVGTEHLDDDAAGMAANRANQPRGGLDRHQPQ